METKTISQNFRVVLTFDESLRCPKTYKYIDISRIKCIADLVKDIKNCFRLGSHDICVAVDGIRFCDSDDIAVLYGFTELCVMPAANSVSTSNPISTPVIVNDPVIPKSMDVSENLSPATRLVNLKNQNERRKKPEPVLSDVRLCALFNGSTFDSSHIEQNRRRDDEAAKKDMPGRSNENKNESDESDEINCTYSQESVMDVVDEQHPLRNIVRNKRKRIRKRRNKKMAKLHTNMIPVSTQICVRTPLNNEANRKHIRFQDNEKPNENWFMIEYIPGMDKGTTAAYNGFLRRFNSDPLQKIRRNPLIPSNVDDMELSHHFNFFLAIDTLIRAKRVWSVPNHSTSTSSDTSSDDSQTEQVEKLVSSEFQRSLIDLRSPRSRTAVVSQVTPVLGDARPSPLTPSIGEKPMFEQQRLSMKQKGQSESGPFVPLVMHKMLKTTSEFFARFEKTSGETYKRCLDKGNVSIETKMNTEPPAECVVAQNQAAATETPTEHPQAESVEAQNQIIATDTSNEHDDVVPAPNDAKNTKILTFFFDENIIRVQHVNGTWNFLTAEKATDLLEEVETIQAGQKIVFQVLHLDSRFTPKLSSLVYGTVKNVSEEGNRFVVVLPPAFVKALLDEACQGTLDLLPNGMVALGDNEFEFESRSISNLRLLQQ